MRPERRRGRPVPPLCKTQWGVNGSGFPLAVVRLSGCHRDRVGLDRHDPSSAKPRETRKAIMARNSTVWGHRPKLESEIPSLGSVNTPQRSPMANMTPIVTQMERSQRAEACTLEDRGSVPIPMAGLPCKPGWSLWAWTLFRNSWYPTAWKKRYAARCTPRRALRESPGVSTRRVSPQGSHTALSAAWAATGAPVGGLGAAAGGAGVVAGPPHGSAKTLEQHDK